MQDKYQTYRTAAYESAATKGKWHYWVYMPAGNGHISAYAHEGSFLHSSHFKIGVSHAQAVEMLATLEQLHNSHTRWDGTGTPPWQQGSDKIHWPDFVKAKHFSEHPLSVLQDSARRQDALQSKHPRSNKFRLGAP